MMCATNKTYKPGFALLDLANRACVVAKDFSKGAAFFVKKAMEGVGLGGQDIIDFIHNPQTLKCKIDKFSTSFSSVLKRIPKDPLGATGEIVSFSTRTLTHVAFCGLLYNYLIQPVAAGAASIGSAVVTALKDTLGSEMMAVAGGVLWLWHGVAWQKVLIQLLGKLLR